MVAASVESVAADFTYHIERAKAQNVLKDRLCVRLTGGLRLRLRLASVRRIRVSW
jgi:hypothetical protein